MAQMSDEQYTQKTRLLQRRITALEAENARLKNDNAHMLQIIIGNSVIWNEDINSTIERLEAENATLKRRLEQLRAERDTVNNGTVQYHIDMMDEDTLDDLLKAITDDTDNGAVWSAAFELILDDLKYELPSLTDRDLRNIVDVASQYVGFDIAKIVMKRAEAEIERRQDENTCPDCGRDLRDDTWIHQKQIDVCEYVCRPKKEWEL